MIYVRDKGRMCNNLLQFGHVYAFAREHGRKAVSMRFAYKYPWFEISHSRHHNSFRYLLAKTMAKAGVFPVVSYNTPGEISPEKERKILSARNVVVEGWEVRFYDLFLKYRTEITAMFGFLPEVRHAVTPLLESAGKSLKVGLHVRRGDYATWQQGKYLYSDRQFAEVVKRISRLYPDRKITCFVCGNDPTLDPDIYRRQLPDIEFIFPNGNPAEDLCLLSECDLLAGPPSTFSLTAAMYRDIPLYWIMDPEKEITEDSFGRFAELFKKII